MPSTDSAGIVLYVSAAAVAAIATAIVLYLKRKR